MTDREQVRRVYDTVAESYAQLVPDLRFEQPLDVAMIDEFTRRVAGAEPGTVLDAGCGAGRLTGYLAHQGCRVTGIDMSGEMIRIARDTHRNVHFDVGDIADLPHSDGAFAGVVAWYSIIHTPTADLAKVFTEFHRVLRLDGPLLLGFQCGSGTRIISGAYGHDAEMTAELHEPDVIATMLAEAGFAVEAVMTRAPAESFEKHRQAAVLARRIDR